MTATPVDPDQNYGPRRWGSVFALIWLFYLLNPLEAGWEQRDTLSGWVGMVAPAAFAVVYAGAFLALRMNRRMGGPVRVSNRPGVGAAVILGEVVLAVVICFAVGQPGTATAVYIAVTSM